MPNRSLSLVGRAEQSAAAQTVEKKKPARAITAQVQHEIVRRWKFHGQLSREISRGLRIHDREAVERIVQAHISGRGPVVPATRRVA